MLRPVCRLLLLIILASCRETRSESRPNGTPDVATRTGGAELAGDGQGVEFEAPRLIPAVRARIIEIEDPHGAANEKFAALKSGVDILVNAMRADLNRVGATHTAEFYALGDSVLGRAGDDDMVGQVERLIERYEEAMRKAAD